MRLSELQEKVLRFFQENDHDIVYFFKKIEDDIGIDRRRVRIACRALARKGLLKYSTCCDEYFRPCGSGYSITIKGMNFKLLSE